MLQRKKVLTRFIAIPVQNKRFSSDGLDRSFERNRFRSVRHPDNRSESVSSMLLSEQTALQKHSSDVDTVGPESRLPERVRVRSHIITQENQHTRLTDILTPLWKVPYKKQLNIKFLTSVDFLKSLRKKLEKRCVDLDRNQYDLPCDLSQSVASPKWRGYQNKDDFAVHVGVDRYTPTVGYCLGNARDLKSAVCIEPNQLTNVKPEHKQVAKLFQAYVQKSILPVTEDLSRNHWRKLLVRSNQKGELMVSASMHPQRLDQSEIDREKQELVRFFTEGPGSELDLRGIFFQTCLFQVLTEAADLRPDSTLLDVNCGAGAIGLHLSHLANRVIGVKRTPGKIDTVFYNAESNGISNVNFTQRALPSVLRQLRKSSLTDVVAVINPSKYFLTRQSVIMLKAIKSLRRIVYITDQMDGRAVGNILMMCQTSGIDSDGPQFFPVKATPVDIYPQTNSFYFVIVFERYSPR